MPLSSGLKLEERGERENRKEKGEKEKEDRGNKYNCRYYRIQS
jgi:hypothetical protein